jgi:glycosyltransferase involved in cell wall biosynthesis
MTTSPSDLPDAERAFLLGDASRTIFMAYRFDPLDPRSWSGTTRNLADGLVAAGWTVEGQPLDVSPRALDAAQSVHRWMRLGPDAARNPVLRRRRAHHLRQHLGHSPASVVLHIGTMHLPYGRRLRAGRRHVMFIDTTWRLWSEHRENIGSYPAWFKRAADRDERRAYLQMDHIFTVSRRACQSVVEDYGVRPDQVTPVGTGLGQVLPTAERTTDEGPRLLFVGKHRLVDKGLDVAVSALALVRQRHPNATLTVVGRLPPAVVAGPGVDVRPWVEPHELAQLYADADLFVLPARNEPWGLVYLEALSQGTPILGVDRHGFRELAGDGSFGVIVEKPDPRLVADAILKALTDRLTLAAKGARGQLHVAATADWARVAGEITSTLARMP